MIPFSEMRKLWFREPDNFPKGLFLVNGNVELKHGARWKASATSHHLSRGQSPTLSLRLQSQAQYLAQIGNPEFAAQRVSHLLLLYIVHIQTSY